MAFFMTGAGAAAAAFFITFFMAFSMAGAVAAGYATKTSRLCARPFRLCAPLSLCALSEVVRTFSGCGHFLRLCALSEALFAFEACALFKAVPTL